MKRINSMLVKNKLAGRRLVGAIPLSQGGMGLLFEGNRILDMKGYLLDQAESVNELAALKAKARSMFQFELPEEQPLVMKTENTRKMVVEAGGEPLGVPEFDVPWEPTRASAQERDEIRMRRLSETRVIDDFALDEGFEV